LISVTFAVTLAGDADSRVRRQSAAEPWRTGVLVAAAFFTAGRRLEERPIEWVLALRRGRGGAFRSCKPYSPEQELS
jgi:hypothetical protein